MFHFCRSATFIGLFTLKSNDCRIPQIPPGIIASSVRWSLFKILFTSLVLWQLSYSNTNKVSPAPSLLLHTLVNQSLVMHWSNQPFGCTCMIIPFGKFTFGIVLRLKTTQCESLPPSAVQPSITVNLFFSLPIVFIEIVLEPLWVIVSAGK